MKEARRSKRSPHPSHFSDRQQPECLWNGFQLTAWVSPAGLPSRTGRRAVRSWPGALWAFALGAGVAAAAPVATWQLDAVLERVPPLKHDATGRLPMITWPAFVTNVNDRSFHERKPLPPEAYRELARRGLTQRIRLDPSFIPMAQAIQSAGAAVIVVEGWAGPGPYALGPDPWHKLPEDFVLPEKAKLLPCPMLFEGWAAKANEIRTTLRAFREAGVVMDAVWLDWEVEPWAYHGWDQVTRCRRCRALLPPGVLDSLDNYTRYIVRLRGDLFSAYVAAPVLESFPGCSVTDWAAVVSTPQRPTPSVWGNWTLPPRGIGLFTASNPVAYGNDIYYAYHWKTNWNYPLDVRHMDRVYTSVMLGQVSANAENLRAWGPDKQCVPWVCRYCPDAGDDRVPILSRERYRELLRHIWLRGADSMQIFNEPRPKHPQICIEEVEDAVAVYDEMLAWRPFLERGEVLNTETPDVTYDGAIWSGLRLDNEAVLRAFTQARQPVRFSVTLWPDATPVELEAPPRGATYHLERRGDQVRIVSRVP